MFHFQGAGFSANIPTPAPTESSSSEHSSPKLEAVSALQAECARVCKLLRIKSISELADGLSAWKKEQIMASKVITMYHLKAQENESLARKISQLELKLDQVKSGSLDTPSLQTQLQEKEIVVKNMDAKIKDLRRQVEMLQDRLAQKYRSEQQQKIELDQRISDAVKDYKAKYEEEAKRRAGYQSAVELCEKAAADKIKQMEADLNSALERVAQFQSRNRQLESYSRNAISAMEQKVHQKTLEIEILMGKYQDVQRLFESEKSRVQEMDKKLHLFNQEKEELKQSLQDAELRNKSLQSEVESVKKRESIEMSALKTKLSTLQAANQQLLHHIKEIDERKRTRDKEDAKRFKSLEDQSKTLARERDTLRQKLRESEGLTKTIQIECDKLRSELKALQEAKLHEQKEKVKVRSLKEYMSEKRAQAQQRTTPESADATNSQSQSCLPIHVAHASPDNRPTYPSSGGANKTLQTSAPMTSTPRIASQCIVIVNSMRESNDNKSVESNHSLASGYLNQVERALFSNQAELPSCPPNILSHLSEHIALLQDFVIDVLTRIETPLIVVQHNSMADKEQRVAHFFAQFPESIVRSLLVRTGSMIQSRLSSHISSPNARAELLMKARLVRLCIHLVTKISSNSMLQPIYEYVVLPALLTQESNAYIALVLLANVALLQPSIFKESPMTDAIQLAIQHLCSKARDNHTPSLPNIDFQKLFESVGCLTQQTTLNPWDLWCSKLANDLIELLESSVSQTCLELQVFRYAIALSLMKTEQRGKALQTIFGCAMRREHQSWFAFSIMKHVPFHEEFVNITLHLLPGCIETNDNDASLTEIVDCFRRWNRGDELEKWLNTLRPEQQEIVRNKLRK